MTAATPWLQYGALGLCAILVGIVGATQKRFARYVENLGRVIERKDAQLLEQTKVHAELSESCRDSIREMILTLKNRPCLRDSSLQEKR